MGQQGRAIKRGRCSSRGAHEWNDMWALCTRAKVGPIEIEVK